MSDTKKIIPVSQNHIEAGIKKYEGVIDTHLAALIKSAGLTYAPYLFRDDRMLLVLQNNIWAFLYLDKEFLFKTLNLE